MKKKLSFKKKLIIVIAVVLLLASAAAAIQRIFPHRHTYPKELVVADSLCDSHPDRAKAALRRFLDEDLADEADLMYYRLVCIKASNNLYEPQKDSIIFSIVDFFEDYGDKDKRREAYYYLGKYYVEHNDAPEAVKCFQKALDLSDDGTPLSFKSMAYNQCGKIFLFQNLFEDALIMYEKSYRCDSLLNDTANIVYSLQNIAQTYKHLKKPDKCINILRQAYKMAEEIKHNELTNSISLVLASQYYYEGDTKEAKRLVLENLRTLAKDNRSVAYSILSDSYEKEGKTDSAFYYDSKIMSVGTVYAKEKSSRRLALYYSEAGNPAEAAYYINQNRRFSDSIQKISAAGAVATIHALYDYSLREKEISRLSIKIREKTIAIIVTLLFIVCLTFLLIYNNEKNKKRYMRLEILNEHLNAMCESVKDKSTEDKHSSEIPPQQTTEHDTNTANNRRLYIYNLIQNRLNKRKNVTTVDWKSIEDAIDFIYPQFK